MSELKNTKNIESYFAYGSNLDNDQMERRAISSKSWSIGYLPDYTLAFTQYFQPWGGGVADVVEQAGYKVWGKLYELSIEDLERLDYYEGHPTDYVRKQYNILTPDGVQHLAWVYSVVIKEGDFIPPSKRYMETIIRAARSSQLPESYISFLESIRTADS